MTQQYIEKRREIAEKLALKDWSSQASHILFAELPDKMKERLINGMLPLAEVCLAEMAQTFRIGYQTLGIDLVRTEPHLSTDEHLKLIGLTPE